MLVRDIIDILEADIITAADLDVDLVLQSTLH